MNVAHAELARDLMGLIDAAAAQPPHIEFLQRDDIRPAGIDDGGYPGRRQPAVGPKAAVNIVG